MTKKAIWSLVILVVVVIIIIIAAGGKKGSQETGPIKIGFSGPLTGEAVTYGEASRDGALLAQKEINDAGGINGRSLEIIFEDDQCDAKGGVSAFNKLVNIDKVTAIIGSVCTAPTAPGAPVAQQAGIPSIVWGSAPNLPKIGDYIFRTYPSDSFQGKYVAEYVYNKLGKRNVAILYIKNDWGQGLNDVFTKRFEELGGKIVFVDSLAQDATDAKTQITKIKDANPDAVFIPLYPTIGAIAIKQMHNLGVTVPLIGGDSFGASEITDLPEAKGVLYVVPNLGNPDEFKARIKAVTGNEASTYTPVAYDSVMILSEIMKKVGTDQVKIQKELEKLNYTKGISLPEISFDADGDLKSAVYEIREVIEGGSQSYSIQ